MDELFSALNQVTLSNIVPTALVLIGGTLVVKAILKLAKKSLSKTRLEKAAASLIYSLLKVVLFLLLGLMAAAKLGIDVTGVVALASVASLALSLALQDSLSNVIGGFLLLSNHPFRSGDFVEIAGQSGTVQEIGLAYTKLTTPDNKMISIPNSAVTAAQIINYSATGTRRIDFVVSASYDSPMDRVLEALHQAAQVEGVLAEPAPMAAVQGYDESTIRYVMQVWVSKEQYWNVNFAINRRIKECFDEKGVEMSYPHLNIHVDK